MNKNYKKTWTINIYKFFKISSQAQQSSRQQDETEGGDAKRVRLSSDTSSDMGKVLLKLRQENEH